MNSDLIGSLVADLKPAKPRRPMVHCALILLLSNLVIGAGHYLFLEHRTLEDLLGDKRSLLSDALFLVTSFLAVGAATVLSVPGHPKQRIARALIVSVLALAGALLIGMAVFHSDSAWEDAVDWNLGLGCAVAIGALSFVPAFVALWVMRKWAPISQALVGALLGLGIALSAAVALSFSCSWSEPGHLFVYHFALPAIVFAIIFSFLGKRLLRW